MEVKVKMLNGKITSKDIINRRYDNESKECIGFTYNLIVENEKGLGEFNVNTKSNPFFIVYITYFAKSSKLLISSLVPLFVRKL